MSSTLFGAPLGYSTHSLEMWISELTESWTAFAKAPPGELRADLAKLKVAFSPGTSPRSLRTAVQDLPIRGHQMSLPDGVAIRLHDGLLITPEGRILLSILEDLRREQLWVIPAERQIEALCIAVEARAAWHRSWLRKQFGGTLSPAALGAAVFLLINGSMTPMTALVLPSDEKTDRRLASVVLPIIGAFSSALGGKEPERDVGLRRHWAFTQISRFLGQDIVRIPHHDGAAMYIRSENEKHLVNDLATRLGKFDITLLTTALDQFVADYRDRRGKLISLGSMHEDPTHTRRVVRALTSNGVGL